MPADLLQLMYEAMELLDEGATRLEFVRDALVERGDERFVSYVEAARREAASTAHEVACINNDMTIVYRHGG